MKIVFDRSAQKYLQEVQERYRRRILEGINGLLNTPPKGDITPMHGARQGCSRLRIGSYRIIYRIDNDTVRILKIAPRGDVYKGG